MITTESLYSHTMFSKEAIEKQLENIVAYELFQASPILKNFLVFIVEQTLSGHANQIKEYTIAVNVLGKPKDFKTQSCGIVRIHAARLRRTLDSYYNESGFGDQICISIPKGAYVPVFNANDPKHQSISANSTQNKTTIGIVSPVWYNTDSRYSSFADALSVQLSTTLMHSEQFSIIAYNSMKKIFDESTNIEQLASVAGVQYLLTGDLQLLGNDLRIHLQLIGLKTGYLVWSKMFKRNFSTKNLFEIQDEIVYQAATELARFNNNNGSGIRND